MNRKKGCGELEERARNSAARAVCCTCSCLLASAIAASCVVNSCCLLRHSSCTSLMSVPKERVSSRAFTRKQATWGPCLTMLASQAPWPLAEGEEERAPRHAQGDLDRMCKYFETGALNDDTIDARIAAFKAHVPEALDAEGWFRYRNTYNNGTPIMA